MSDGAVSPQNGWSVGVWRASRSSHEARQAALDRETLKGRLAAEVGTEWRSDVQRGLARRCRGQLLNLYNIVLTAAPSGRIFCVVQTLPAPTTNSVWRIPREELHENHDIAQ